MKVKSISFLIILVLIFAFTSFINNNYVKAQKEEDVWYPLNNGLTGGVITSLVMDSSIEGHYIAGANKHGVFETTNFGQDWISIGKNLEDKRVLSVALDVSDVNYIYAGTYNQFYYTNDHGVKWEKANVEFNRINFIKVWKDRTIFIGTKSGLFKSYSKNERFKFYRIIDNNVAYNEILAIAFNPKKQNIIYVGTFDRGVSISQDGGNTWKNISNSLPKDQVVSLIFDKGNSDILYAFLKESGVWRYRYKEDKIIDDKEPWEKVSKLEKSLLINCATPSESNYDEILVGTDNNGLYKYNIKSSELTKVESFEYSSRVSCIATSAKEKNTILLGLPGRGCVKSTNDGSSWNLINNGLNAIEVYDIAIDKDDLSKWIAVSDGCVFMTNNSGANWNCYIEGLPDVVLTCIAIDPENTNHMYTGSFGNGLYESTDGGTKWFKNDNLKYTKINCLSIEPQNPKVIYVGTFASGIFQSKDGGKSWQNLSLGTKAEKDGRPTDGITVLTIDPEDTEVVYAGTDTNGIFRSVNQGKSWLHIYEVLGVNVYVNDIKVYDKENNIVYAGIKIINDGGFIKSSNGGDLWEATNIFRGGMVFNSICIDNDDPGIIFGGTNEGAFYTKDSGYHWYNYDSGLEKELRIIQNQFPVNRILNHPVSKNRLIAATSNGVYECIKSRKLMDKTPPEIKIENYDSLPIFTNKDKLLLEGRVIDEFGIEYLKINGKDVDFDKQSGNFSYTQNLKLGINDFVIEAKDISLNTSELRFYAYLDETPPNLEVSKPTNYLRVNKNSIQVAGKAMDHESGMDKVLINNISIPFDKEREDGYFEYTYKGLKIGKNIIEVKAIDKAKNEETKQIEITFEIEDKNPPIVELINPSQELFYTNKYEYDIEVKVSDSESGIFRVKLNNEIIDLNEEEKFIYKAKLQVGENNFLIYAEDYKGNSVTKNINIFYDNEKPKIISQNLVKKGFINTSNKYYPYKFLVSDKLSGIKRVNVFLNNNIYKEFNNLITENIILELNLVKGINDLLVFVEDYAGNFEELKEKIKYVPPIIIILKIGNNKAKVTKDEIEREVILDTKPILYKNRTMVPLRFISESFDAEVNWIPHPTNEVQIRYKDKFIRLWINSKKAKIEYPPELEKSPEIVTLDTEPIIINGRTLVPLRFIGEEFGAKVDWDSKEQKVEIYLDTSNE